MSLAGGPEKGWSGSPDDAAPTTRAKAPKAPGEDEPPRALQRPRVTWADDSVPAPSATSASADAAASEEEESRRSLLRPEEIDDLLEMRALLPTLRSLHTMLAERGGETPTTGREDDNPRRLTMETESASSTSSSSLPSFSEFRDEAQPSQGTRKDLEIAEEKEDDDQFLCDSEVEFSGRSYGQSILQHISKGIRKEHDVDSRDLDTTRVTVERRSWGQSIMQHISKGISSPRRFSEGGSSSSSTRGQRGHVLLPRDVYSLIYVCRPRSLACFFAMGTFFFQVFILGLILVDIVQQESRNPINIPAGVSVVVSVAQFVAILIAVATQDDLITAINEWHVGYGRGGASMGDGTPVPGGARWQWLLSLLTRLAQGGLCLSVTFILIMQSEDVVELFLNFLAVTFVSTLDDIVFTLAREGYFAQRLKEETDAVCRVQVPRRMTRSHLYRPMVFFLISALMLAGWGFIMARQRTGGYLSCQNIAVQFGDDFAATLGFFSGTYRISHFDKSHRPVYLETNVALGEGLESKGMFAYCKELEAWTFSYPNRTNHVANPCHWDAKSTETDAYDIMEISPSDWYVYGRTVKKPVPFQHFQMLCVDCDGFNGRGSCGGVGTCINNQCVCDNGRYGLQCEFEEPCASIKIDTEFGRFPGLPGLAHWAEHFSVLHYCNSTTDKVALYGRPVYVSEEEIESSLQVILYTGRRWAVARAADLRQDMQHFDHQHISDSINISRCDLADALVTSFHAHWDNFNPRFISSPTDVGSPTDSATPVGLTWYKANTIEKSANLNARVPTQFLCTRCDEERNPCNNGGVCQEDGRCECSNDTYGDLCQIKSVVLCNRIAVNMGDAFGASLGGLSGTYALFGDDIVKDRAVYLEERQKGALFAYCTEEMAWTFTILSDHWGDEDFLNNSVRTEFDPCANWTATSPYTESYDITTVASNWVARRGNSSTQTVPFDSFLLWCNNCNRTNNPCSGAGECGSDGRCSCDEGRSGLSCEIRESCSELVLDQSWERFQSALPRSYNPLYDGDGERVLVYENPVYYAAMPSANQTFSEKKNYAVLLFGGHRWLAVNSKSIPTLRNGTTSEELAQYLSNDFHAYFSSYRLVYVSEPVDSLSSTVVVAPTSLDWYEPDPLSKLPSNPDTPISAKLHCAFCSAGFPCYNGGSCIEDKCRCQLGTYGSHCQIDSICMSLSIAFAGPLDNEVQKLGGIYDVRDVQTEYSDRPVYILQGGNNAMIAYCYDMEHWTFTFWDANSTKQTDIDPCVDFFARTSWTSSFDVLSESTWFIPASDGIGFVAVAPTAFSFMCNDQY